MSDEVCAPAGGLTGLVLSGGGARAAYQVGVLTGLSELLAQQGMRHNPFPIIVGTSAGAINATALATGADDFHDAVARIAEVWENFSADQVYRTDTLGVGWAGMKWLSALAFGWILSRWAPTRPRSLLDNRPLATLLARLIDPQRIQSLLARGVLHAVAVNASSYTSGHNVTYYQSEQAIDTWTRSQRLAIRESISIEHLLASSAIPFVFPAQQLLLNGQPEYFGDGSMRQLAPISPAIHLGANRVLVIGVGRLHEPPPPPGPQPVPDYPSLAQIAGHALSSIFLDGLSVDIERMMRINKTLALLPEAQRQQSSLRPIDVLLISPTQRLDDIAARHTGSLPFMVRALLRGVGGTEGRSGGALASYLLFESSYTRELIALGKADTLAKRSQVISFLRAAEDVKAA